jgi:hypothetical protein
MFPRHNENGCKTTVFATMPLANFHYNQRFGIKFDMDGPNLGALSPIRKVDRSSSTLVRGSARIV